MNSVEFHPFEIPDFMNRIIRAPTPAVDEIQVIEEQVDIQAGPIIAENVKEQNKVSSENVTAVAKKASSTN